ncbi:MAG: hypothetical protein RL216_744 [Pseudomonadota bacterium]
MTFRKTIKRKSLLFPMTRDDQKVRIMIADDHEMVLEVFRLYLQSNTSFEVTTANTLDEALAATREQGPFSLSLLDWNMPGMQGVQGLRRALQLADSNPVGIITGDISRKGVDEVLAAGAAGIVLKSSGIRSLTNAIGLMLNGERYLPFNLMVAQRDNDDRKSDALTPKELQVLSEIAKGRRNKEICAELQIAMPTVKMHITAICRKLEAKNRLHATVVARDLGIL